MKATAVVMCVVAASTGLLAAQDLIEIREDFSRDPGWEGVQNRIVAEDAPTVKQDFGWTAGKIGGTVWQSRMPAYYAVPLEKPLSFDDAFSFSCTIEFLPEAKQLSPKASINAGNAYIGFFNAERQGYRPWSSVALRLNGSGSDAGGKQSSIGMWLAYMSAGYGAGGADLNLFGRTWLADGKPHTLRVSYDPDATPPKQWADPKLKTYFTAVRMNTSELLDRAKQAEPGLTEQQLLTRVRKAVAEGVVQYHRLGGRQGDEDTWHISDEPMRGAFTMEFDDARVKTFMSEAHRAQELKLDRFGIFNHQVYHHFLKFRFGDLTVNGKKIDLSTDPKWEAVANRKQYVEQDFQRQDFGYSPDTTYAGGKKGEIGGLFSRTAFNDPNHGYYADDVGKLTLDDPISFSGKIGFPGGNTDAGMYVGYFNAAEEMKTLTSADEGRSVSGALGIIVEATSARGYDFSALIHPIGKSAGLKYGTNFVPRAEPYSFTFEYDPQGADGFGQIRFALNNGDKYTQNLTREQRESGMTFDRFGLVSRRAGGTYVVLYFDDLVYTARRFKDHPTVRHQQKKTVVRYPMGGREG